MIKTYNQHQKVKRQARKDGSINLFIQLQSCYFQLDSRLNVGAEDDFGYWAHKYWKGMSDGERFAKLRSLEDIRDMWDRLKEFDFQHEDDKRLVMRELRMLYKERKTRVELYGKAIYTRIYWPEDWSDTWTDIRGWSNELGHSEDPQQGMGDFSHYMYKMSELPKNGRPLRKLPDGFYKWAAEKEEVFFIRTIKEHEISGRGVLEPGDRVIYFNDFPDDSSLFGQLQDDDYGEYCEDFARSYFGIGQECSNCRGGGCIHCEPQHFL